MNGFEDESSMESQKWLFNQCVKENLSIVAVLDDQDPKPVLVGRLKLVIVSKEDAEIPAVRLSRYLTTYLLAKIFQSCWPRKLWLITEPLLNY